ncbi:MAG: hypothetical protein VYC39_17420 [Myxococcota bacterium]|nr:hypothetical protein [Myxococcota bacterium]
MKRNRWESELPRLTLSFLIGSTDRRVPVMGPAVRKVRSDDDPWWRISVRTAARLRLRDLVVSERKRAQLHIALIKETNPEASPDRVARILVQRFKKLASVEGGITGAVGAIGVPVNFIMFTYFQLAMIVAIAEAYSSPLDDERGEQRLVEVLGRAHGIEDILRTTPKIIGTIAVALASKYGLSTLGRLVPLLSAPLSARMNARDMERTGSEALRTFGNVFQVV